MSEVMECTSCGFKNWQTTCWSCNAVLPVTKQVEELKAENERLREAMEKIANDKMLDIITATDIAVQALEGGDQ